MSTIPNLTETSPKEGESSDITITLYSAEWCSACKAFKEEWEKLEGLAKKHNIKTVDIESEVLQKLVKEYADKGKTYDDYDLITGFPTIIIKVGNDKTKYEGDRTADAIIKAAKGNIQSGGSINTNYKLKYLKYKAKYMELRSKA